MYDPDTYATANIPPVRPRVATAPVINRFDIRQDGDSEKVAGVPLRLFGNPTVEAEIVSAVYGAGDNTVDVTDKVKKAFDGHERTNIGKYNDLFGDPIYKTVKTLKVTVKFKDGKVQQFEFPEDVPMIIKE